MALLKTLIGDHNSFLLHCSLVWPLWQHWPEMPCRFHGWDQKLHFDVVSGDPVAVSRGSDDQTISSPTSKTAGLGSLGGEGLSWPSKPQKSQFVGCLSGEISDCIIDFLMRVLLKLTA